MSLVEQRSMFTMWAALPAPLILSADLRPGAASGGIDDQAIMDILTNVEVIMINQDAAAQPMVAVRKAQGLEVWKKPLAVAGSNAVILFHRNDTLAAAAPRTIAVSWAELGFSATDKYAVRDLWAKANVGIFAGGFNASIAPHEARIYKFEFSGAMDAL